jgi:inosine-uridine nucleoside N-ribohydrolase
VVDTDLAADDLVALAFLLSSPHAEVRAITVSGTGEVRCPAGLEVISGLLELTDQAEIPVACGRSTPLAGDREFPREWRDASDVAWGVELPNGAPPSAGTTAVELLADTLDRRTTLLTLGPLTNVAEAFREEPALAGRIGPVVVMGGAVGVGGNVFLEDEQSPVAEWNMYVDPTAAGEVLASGAAVTLVGLDATNQAPITSDFVEEVQENADGDAGKVVGELLAGNPLVTSGEASFWDPLAAAVVLDPSLVDTEEMQVDVVTDGEDSGRTVEDEGGASVDVAVGADADTLEGLLLATLT